MLMSQAKRKEMMSTTDKFGAAQADVFAAIREARRYPTAANRQALDDARTALQRAADDDRAAQYGRTHTLYSVCVNAAGCLPDSETYPYIVTGLDDARQALADECALHILGGEYGGDTPEVTAQHDECLEDGGEALERGEDVSISLDADGIYRLTIEALTCEYSAAHKIRAERPSAVARLDCGALGDIPACADCVAFFLRQGGRLSGEVI